jgi:hypothetical protein
MLSILALKFPKVLIMGYKDVCKKEMGARSPYVRFLVSTSLVICNITYNCFCGCDQFLNTYQTSLHYHSKMGVRDWGWDLLGWCEETTNTLIAGKFENHSSSIDFFKFDLCLWRNKFWYHMLQLNNCHRTTITRLRMRLI